MGKFKADLDLHKLEIFYWVAEMRSFSQAADLLSLRQPTVSAHIQELEQSVGGKLLYRIRGRVSLTPLGQLLAERAKNLLALKRETVAAVELFHGTLSGELWVGGREIAQHAGGVVLVPRGFDARGGPGPIRPAHTLRDDFGRPRLPRQRSTPDFVEGDLLARPILRELARLPLAQRTQRRGIALEDLRLSVAYQGEGAHVSGSLRTAPPRPVPRRCTS